MMKCLANSVIAFAAAMPIVAAASAQTVDAPGSHIAAISLGESSYQETEFICILTTEGGMKCLGNNSNGQLGDGTTKSRRELAPVHGLESGVAAIAAGWSHACALTTGGSMLCWGSNRYGQLGNGTTTDGRTPAPVPGLESGVAAIAASGDNTCALTTGGGVKCWGENRYGQAGDGTMKKRLIPTQVLGLESGVSSITMGIQHSWGMGHACAAKTNGGIVCWGNDDYGQIGLGTTKYLRPPTPVPGVDKKVASLALGLEHTCALTVDGEVWCWGSNEFGKLGDGTTTRRQTPTQVSGLPSGVSLIAAGVSHTCALTSAGESYCWGANDLGQLLDNGKERKSLTPVKGVSGGMTGIWLRNGITCSRAAASFGCRGYGEDDLNNRLRDVPSQPSKKK